MESLLPCLEKKVGLQMARQPFLHCLSPKVKKKLKMKQKFYKVLLVRQFELGFAAQRG
jgi:hypothetical protein